MAWYCRRCGAENPSARPVCHECGEESPALRFRERSTPIIGCFVLLVPLCCLAYSLWSLWRG